MKEINKQAITESESLVRGVVEATKTYNAIVACDPADIHKYTRLQHKHESALLALGTVVFTAAHEPQGGA